MHALFQACWSVAIPNEQNKELQNMLCPHHLNIVKDKLLVKKKLRWCNQASFIIWIIFDYSTRIRTATCLGTAHEFANVFPQCGHLFLFLISNGLASSFCDIVFRILAWNSMDFCNAELWIWSPDELLVLHIVSFQWWNANAVLTT